MESTRLIAYIDEEITISMTTGSCGMRIKSMQGNKMILQIPESKLNGMLEPRMRCAIEYAPGTRADGVIENIRRHGEEFDITCILSDNISLTQEEEA
jgi:hypothetical protein